ncbi:hypothetical protein STHAL_33465 [Streptomyces halstedii]|uniref:Uncharacterized protein n=1 Tax=Streptomyces halstedii TaxID=1944 RepID=A0ABS6U1G6_STRHA|nr:hypothetical protein [Streptomyces halstedii]MBV7674355.1 hypothetical protein [Streptomyces halstedii]
MALRKWISIGELAANTTAEDQAKHGTDYSASQGGWVRPKKDKPVPGAGNGSKGRLRRGER